MGENLTKNLKNDRVEKIILEICDSIQITHLANIIISQEKVVIEPEKNQELDQEIFKN